MRDQSQTRQAIVVSKRSISFALVGGSLLVGLLIIERYNFDKSMSSLKAQFSILLKHEMLARGREGHQFDFGQRGGKIALPSSRETVEADGTKSHIETQKTFKMPVGEVEGRSKPVQFASHNQTQLMALIDERLRFSLEAGHYTYGGLVIAVIGWIIFLCWYLHGRIVSSKQQNDREEERVRALTSVDSVTGLINRECFKRRAQVLLDNVTESDGRAAVIMIDLDYFKPVNDIHGHEMGDKVLHQVGEIISGFFRGSDIVARYGGDEFVVALSYDKSEERIVKRAQNLITRLFEPMTIEDQSIVVGASVGIASYPDNADGLDDLIRKADIALYHAKHLGRGTAQCFTSEMTENISQIFQHKNTLRDAIDNEEIIPYFQPIVELESGNIVHLELLARWRHPKRGILGPHEFLSNVMEYGLTNKMSLSLLDQACKAINPLSSEVSFALNVTAMQVQDAWFFEKLQYVLDENKFSYDRLIVEIEESALITNLVQAKETILSLHANNIRVMMDDFGTGHSSLTYVAELPFDALKIDKSFVLSMLTREEMHKVVSSIISLGHSFDVDIIAEGVERAEHARALFELGCRYGQGYFFSKPVPGDQLSNLLGKPPCNVREIQAYNQASG